MSDPRHVALQSAICNYIENQKGSVADPDSLDVALQCLTEQWNLSPATRAGYGQSTIDALLAAAAGASSSTAGVAAAAPEPMDDGVAGAPGSRRCCGLFGGVSAWRKITEFSHGHRAPAVCRVAAV